MKGQDKESYVEAGDRIRRLVLGQERWRQCRKKRNEEGEGIG